MDLSDPYTSQLKEYHCDESNYYPLFIRLDNLNFDHLRRKRMGNL